MKTYTSKEKITYDYQNQKSGKGKKITFETAINCKAEEVWKLYQEPSEWLKNLNPQARLVPTSDNKNIEQWIIDKNYSFILYMYGFIPFGRHHISFETIDPENLMIQSREHGFLVPHWDNYFEIVPLTDTTCLIRDILTIETIGVNPIVALYATGVFRAKHKKIANRFR